MTVYGYLVDKRAIRHTDMNDPTAIKQEMLAKKDEILWVHADESADVFRLQDTFGLHPLAVDAILHENQPPKIEGFERYLFTITHGIVYRDELNGHNLKGTEGKAPFAMDLIVDQVFIFLEHRWIITISFHNSHFREHLQKKLRNLLQHSSYSTIYSEGKHHYNLDSENRYYRTPVIVPERLSHQAERKLSEALRMCELIYRLALEEMVSSYYGLLDIIKKELDQAEESILMSNSSRYLKDQPSIILILRRKITFIQGVLETMSRAFEEIIDTDTATNVSNVLSNDTIKQIRAMNDRTMFLRNDLENMHQRIISLRESYNSSLTANLNGTIRTLTLIATIVLPLTLITGIFGMSESYVPQLHPSYGFYYKLGLIAAASVGMVGYFRWKKWI